MQKIVEAVIRNGDQRVPVGLVSVKQALQMPERGCWNSAILLMKPGRRISSSTAKLFQS